MQDNYVIPNRNSSHEEKKKLGSGKKVLIWIGIFILLLVLIAGSYMLGAKSKEGTNKPTPTPPPPTPTSYLFEFPEETPTPITTISATPTKRTTPASSPTPTPTPVSKTEIINSEVSLDGFRSSNGGGNNSSDIRAGRNTDLVTRGFTSFELTNIPKGAAVQKATLKLYQTKVVGKPYSVNGVLKLDHITYGDSLDNNDYAMAALVSNMITISNNSAIEWKEVDVTSTVRNDLANARAKSQYRIHFTQESAGGEITGDFAHFDSANDYTDSTDHIPQLIVKYN